MPFFDTEIEGLKIFEPRVFNDERGYFFESYSQREFEEAGLHYQFVQDNQSKSSYGVVRGLHYQRGVFAQAKLVSAPVGKVLDVVVDIRPGSVTYGKVFSLELSEENKRQLMIPRGFAHGYSVISESAIFCYKCDNFYARPHEAGIRVNDPTLNIDWRIPESQQILSGKDQQYPEFGQHLPIW